MTFRDPFRSGFWVLVVASLLAVGCRAESPRPGTEARASAAASGEPQGGRAAPPQATAAPPALRSQQARRDLQADERRGGHTIARHVARDDDDLRDRLRRERISAASTYDDLATAERVVFETLTRAARRIEGWQSADGSRPNLAVRYRGDPVKPIGRSLSRGRPDPVPCYDAVVVLRWDARAGDYYVLTSYPEARR